MKIAVWVWQIGEDYPSNLEADDTKLPISAVYLKVADHLNWMNVYDSRGVTGPNDFGGVVEGFKGQGIECIPWSVASGQPNVAFTEGRMLGECAARSGGRGILDLETSPPFWTGPASQVKEFCRGFIAGGGLELWVAPDGREPHISNVHVDAWLREPVVTRWMPQAYWDEFRTDWTVGITSAYTPLTSRGVLEAEIFPAFSGGANTQELIEAVRWSQQSPPFGGFSLWRRGTVRAETYEALEAEPAWPLILNEDYPIPPVAPPEPIQKLTLHTGKLVGGKLEGGVFGKGEFYDIPCTGWVSYTFADHPPIRPKGIDIRVRQGSPLRAIISGTVTRSGIEEEDPEPKDGSIIILSEDNRYSVSYYHIDVTQSFAHVGAKVKAGELIGYSGGEPGTPGAGISQEAHLHLGIQAVYRGVNDSTFIDPLGPEVEWVELKIPDVTLPPQDSSQPVKSELVQKLEEALELAKGLS